MSPWVGGITPQATGSDPPTSVITASTGNQRRDSAQVTISTPAGISAGDLMLFGVALTPDFVNFTSRSLPAGVTMLTDPSFTYGYSMVGYRIADANDAAATTSYTWSASNSGGIGYSAATLASWPASFGTTPATAQVTTSTSPSIVPTAGADWYFVAGLNGKASGGDAEVPRFIMSTAGDFMVQGNYLAKAVARLYSAAGNVNPISGYYEFSGNQPAMSVIGITA